MVLVLFALMDAATAVGKPGGAIADSYKTAAQLKAIAPRSGTVETRAPCYVVLVASDGSRFRIGSPGNTPEFARFVGSLKEGVVYTFPAALLEYEQRMATPRR